MRLEKYSHVLQERLQLTDQQWDYNFADFPNAADTNRAGFVKTCSLIANSTQQSLVLSFTKIPSNRAISAKALSEFIHLTCADFRLHLDDGTPAPFRESADYIARLLKRGLSLNGTKYSFYGHSNSQLKGRSCFLLVGSQAEVDAEVESLGDFSSMKTVAKKAKRIGLLFSTAHSVLDVDPARYRDVPDIERHSYNFTDGCGSISPALAKVLSQKQPILFRNKRYHPSVFQIRYRGYKGVVVQEPRLDPGIWLEFRKSMRKFSDGRDRSFAVVEYSKPFTYGYLNDQIILLMYSLGIGENVFEQKQNEYFDFLDKAGKDPVFAFRFLNSVGLNDLAEQLLLEGIEAIAKKLHKHLDQECAKMLNKRNLQKSRILIPKSRLLFGVCDTRAVLQEGECFVQPTMDEDGKPHKLAGTYVLVARNPCLHPGDLQKLRVVAKPELVHLVDCIVFPVKGRRPPADMMSGGDLDGDTFFVTWDPHLIPAEVSQPAEYPGPKESIRFAPITTSDRIEYFAQSSSMQLGQINNLYLKWARLQSPLSSQCQELNRLFSQCVDANRIQIPPRLKDVPEPSQASMFILDVLHKSAAERIRERERSTLVRNADSVTNLLALLEEPAGYSQFELAQLTLRWCHVNHACFEGFWHLFDPSHMSSEERTWFISQLPQREDIPEAINNDLLQSAIISPQEQLLLGLRGANIKWRLTYTSSSDRLANLLEVLYRTFPYITRKLLVLKIHDRLSIAIYLPQKIDPEDEVALGPRSRVFAFPHRKDSFATTRVVAPTKHNSRLYYDHNGFQLYEGKRGNTFVYLTRAANDDSKYRNIRGIGNRARAREETIQEGINCEWRTSIALNKFSQGVATYVGRLWKEGLSDAELYIISNGDIRSFQNLDLWLEQIDTGHVHRNFDQDDGETMSTSQLTDLCWSEEPDVVTEILRNRRFDLVANASPKNLAHALELGWQTNSLNTVSDLFSACTKHLVGLQPSEERNELVCHLISFLDFMPSMVIHFCRPDFWASMDGLLSNEILGRSSSLLNALVLCANKMGRLAANHLGLLLSKMREISIDTLKEVIILVALTVKSPEIAMDILLERFQLMTSRLLLLTPKNSEYLMNKLCGITMDHIEEAANTVEMSHGSNYNWKFGHPIQRSRGEILLTCDYRIDAPVNIRLKVGEHIRFVCTKGPNNLVVYQPASFEALVESIEVGQVTFKCLRHPPAYYQRSIWCIEHCGSFVTTQTMMDAVAKFILEKEACCEVFSCLMPSACRSVVSSAPVEPSSDLSRLNSAQCSAVIESLYGPVTCIWGPPGTGKTYTTVAVISEILRCDTMKRLLVTAPTHNAVDNILRRFLQDVSENNVYRPVRVSTDLRKVAVDLRSYTCDAMLGKDLNQHFGARQKAQKKISQSRLVFTTCIGAGLGLLRDERFDDVIIDEASQQTEPASLVPIVKGCCRLILVGDHVQLRATVQPNATVLGFDVSLFERLWTSNDGKIVRKVMLDTQYRMHPNICAFPSHEFYQARLQSAPACAQVPLPCSKFAWPQNDCRSVFIQVSAMEDLGRKSKSNGGQADVCEQILSQLRSPPENVADLSILSYSIAILTPYTRQVDLLKQKLPNETISSIDGFQGQEADVIVYVSVRCNAHGQIGFLKDMRRLNVALTRARAGIVIIGDESTLTGQSRRNKPDEEDEEDFHLVWKRLIKACHKVEVKPTKHQLQ